jgi:cytochrome c553
MVRLVFVFGVLLMGASAADEVTVKASGEFARELEALVQKYQNSSANGSIQIIQNANTTADEPNLTKEERIKLSPLEQQMQESIVMDAQGNSTAETYDKYYSDEKINKKSSSNILGVLLDGLPTDGDAGDGKKLYAKFCAQCHGDKAQKSTYAGVRNLVDIPREEIVDLLRSYNRDSGFGGSTGLIMRAEAIKVNDQEMKDIAEYIESLAASK